MQKDVEMKACFEFCFELAIIADEKKNNIPMQPHRRIHYLSPLFRNSSSYKLAAYKQEWSLWQLLVCCVRKLLH